MKALLNSAEHDQTAPEFSLIRVFTVYLDKVSDSMIIIRYKTWIPFW